MGHTYIHIIFILRSKTNQKCWMALDHTSYHHHHNAARNSVVFSLDLNDQQMYWLSGGQEQTKGTETEKARNAKVELAVHCRHSL